MRLNVILFTIILGGLASGAIFFIFGYPVSTPHTNFGIQPPDKTGRAFLLPVTETNYRPVRDFNIAEPMLNAASAALFDVQSGRFLFAKNINKRLPIASVTKLMSAVVVLENLNLNQIFSVPAETINVDGNGADLFKDEQLRVVDLLKIMLVKSSNDAALTLAAEAQKLGINFVSKMNEKARNLGMFNTNFKDPAGLNDYDAFSTASDLIKLVNYAISYEIIPNTLKEKVMDVSSADKKIIHHLVNTNKLLGQIRGIIMGKTGYTDNALGTMVLAVDLDNGGDSLVSVVLGSQDRFGETKKLIEWGMKAYNW